MNEGKPTIDMSVVPKGESSDYSDVIIDNRELKPIDSTEESISILDQEIIDFISDRQIFYDKESKPLIERDVVEKYGQGGLDILNELNNPNQDPDYKVEGCVDCAKQASDWINQTHRQLKIVEQLLDESNSEVVDLLLSRHESSRISKEHIISAIVEVTQKPERKIKDRDVIAIARKLIFKGLVDGWLIDEYFDDVVDPERTKENASVS